MGRPCPIWSPAILSSEHFGLFLPKLAPKTRNPPTSFSGGGLWNLLKLLFLVQVALPARRYESYSYAYCDDYANSSRVVAGRHDENRSSTEVECG